MNFNRKELLHAIDEIRKNPSLKTARHSSTYDLIFENEKFPPILVLSIANKLKGLGELTLSDFKNNVEVPFKILKENGFDIVTKKALMKPDIKKFIQVANEQVTGKGTTESAMNYVRENKEIKSGLTTEISFGVGRASAIPWIAFTGFSQNVRDGIYPVYLYYKEYNLLVLAYGVSETNTPSNNWDNLDSKQNIKKYFNENYSQKNIKYGSSFIYKLYDADNLPTELVLESDLEKLINSYKSQFSNTEILKTTNVQGEKFEINSFNESVFESGLVFSEKLISRFVSSLLTKPFVLLTGLSGSGKTKIAQSFVKWICESENQYKIIPVGADWTNREPLLGYPNGLNPKEYVTPDSGVLNLIIEASKVGNEDKPYFLILDEMNLSHVERYFADFLSVMESDDKIKLYSGSARKDLKGNDVPNEIFWSKNLFIIGTVNIDETTYMFSPKVLDRANTIEFRVDETNIKSFFDLPSKIDLSVLESKGASMAKNFLEIAKDNSIEKDDEYSEIFVKFFNELKKVGAEFGYRTAVEMLLLIKKLNVISTISKDEGIDIAVMQKLLPKLHGSRSKISKVLDALILLCLKDGQTFSIAKRDEVLIENIKYPVAFEKLVRMYKNALDNGFTSYAEA